MHTLRHPANGGLDQQGAVEAVPFPSFSLGKVAPKHHACLVPEWLLLNDLVLVSLANNAGRKGSLLLNP